jgi:hypothetical protein
MIKSKQQFEPWHAFISTILLIICCWFATAGAVDLYSLATDLETADVTYKTFNRLFVFGFGIFAARYLLKQVSSQIKLKVQLKKQVNETS